VRPGLAGALAVLQAMRVKRTNPVLHEKRLEEVTRLSEENTGFSAVMPVPQDFVHRAEARPRLEPSGLRVRGGRPRRDAARPEAQEARFVTLVDTSARIQVLRAQQPLDREVVPSVAAPVSP